jgi:hypothetical protein
LKAHALVRAFKVHETFLGDITHTQYRFGKISMYAAKLHLRRLSLNIACEKLGRDIERCGKKEISTQYMALELGLVRLNVSEMTYYCKAWSHYADLGKFCGESELCRATFELAVSRDAEKCCIV